MNDDEVRAATEAERLSLADLLADLAPAEWTTPSLCDGWTVQDVAAHLATATRLTMVRAIVGIIRARGNLDRLIADSAREWASTYPPGDLVGQLREHAGSARRPPGTGIRDPFVDVLVHGQDIARPLGRERVIPPERAVAALTHLWSGSMLAPSKRFDGLRFVASDADWSAGEGTDEVTGPAADLLVLSTGRPAALAAMSGPGVPEARRRVGG